jgi:hypothetical protein
MSSLPGIKRVFHFGQGGITWCTKCNRLRCKEDVGFLSDKWGRVKGYIIDPERLIETGGKEYSGENKRIQDSPPSDGIFKRPLDVKQLLSREPFNVNTVTFSNDVLKLVLVGAEGCDNFLKGVRSVPCEKSNKSRRPIDLNRKAAEVLNGKTSVTDMKLVKVSEQANYRHPRTNPLSRGY